MFTKLDAQCRDVAVGGGGSLTLEFFVVACHEGLRNVWYRAARTTRYILHTFRGLIPIEYTWNGTRSKEDYTKVKNCICATCTLPNVVPSNATRIDILWYYFRYKWFVFSLL